MKDLLNKKKKLGKQFSLSPDEFTMAVFQSQWERIKKDMVKVFQEFAQNGFINRLTNETFICLIPKKSEFL